MDIDLITENLRAGLQNYGYRVLCTAVPGQEFEHADSLRNSLKMVEQTADCLRQHLRLRGRSKPLIRKLHALLPEPGFGVEAETR